MRFAVLLSKPEAVIDVVSSLDDELPHVEVVVILDSCSECPFERIRIQLIGVKPQKKLSQVVTIGFNFLYNFCVCVCVLANDT